MRHFFCFLLAILISIFIPRQGISQLFGSESDISHATAYALDAEPADIDGDGDLDVVTASRNDDKIAWYENDGSGNFGVQRIISTAVNGANDVHAADIDGDGDMDVVSASYGDNQIAWHENYGSGSFGPLTVISDQAIGISSVYAGDLDGDGDIDLLSSSRNDDKIAWYENDGTGVFGSQQIISSDADNARCVFASDLDGDGDLDVLSASSNDDRIAWYENNGTGDFGAQMVISNLADSPQRVSASDLDGDGDMDVLSTSYSDKEVAWYENLGNGTFSVQSIIATLDQSPTALATADLNGDGDMDVLSAISFDDLILWFQNDGLGGFMAQQVISDLADGPSAIVIGDMNGDGINDVISTSVTDEKVAWYPSDGSGSFGVQNQISTQNNTVNSVYTGDLNGDGAIDVLSSSSYDRKIAWYPNDGSGDFGIQNVISTEAVSAEAIHAADMDGDGDLDVISAGGSLTLFINDGTGNFDDQVPISNISNSFFGSDIFTADLNGDGEEDVIACSALFDEIAWYQNIGAIVFGAKQVVSDQAEQVKSVHAADLDGDGDIDIFSAFDSQLVWFVNDGSGNFGPSQLIHSGLSFARLVYSADLDNDGDMDIIVAYDEDIAWVANDGSGAFGPLQSISSSVYQPNGIYAIDLDGDADMDILSASSFTGNDKVAWYENDGTGGFGSQMIISSSASSPESVFAADMDGDGDPDALSASSGDSKVAWYENLIGEGCTDPSACNYDPDAWIENSSCCYDCGCTVEGAENFDPLACYNDGSCGFQVLGIVFFDEDENGLMDNDEYGLPLQVVTFDTDGLVMTTNDDGNFYVNASGSESYTFTLSQSPLFPFNTTVSSLTFDATESNWNQHVFFGISNESPAFAIESGMYSNGIGYPCDTLWHHDVTFRNMGNVPLDGVVEVEFDPLFQAYGEITPIDSVLGNKVYMSFTELLPGQMLFYDLALHTPTADYLGDSLLSTCRIYGFYNGNEVAFGEDTLQKEITCAYDPNDKQVFPEGYTDAHYVPEDEYLEYLVRFQNTGNAPATDVVIRDTIDEGLDISTFELVANSHSVFTSVDPESREVEFYFQDIQLPDSVNNEPESHGLVSYRIRPEEGIDLLTEINNTAYIFFDNNPPIVTNTTWSMIYNCSLFEVEFMQDGAVLTASEGDNYQWYLNGEPIEGAVQQEFTASENGDYSVEVGNDFPCTDTSISTFILVSSIEDLSNSSISLFPNPMTSSAILDIGERQGPAALEIYDLSGKLMRSEILNLDSGILQIKRQELSSGSYLLRIISEGEAIELPLVVE